jgi:hypothetical protein
VPYISTVVKGTGLLLAYRMTSPGTGNCGSKNSWYCETIVASQSQGQTKNWSNMIHIVPASGLASIAYFVNTKNGNINLCFAYQIIPIPEICLTALLPGCNDLSRLSFLYRVITGKNIF